MSNKSPCCCLDFRNERGASLVELALVVGFFFALVAIAFDIFSAFNARLALQHAITVGARRSVIALPSSETRTHYEIAKAEATTVGASLGLKGISFSPAVYPSYDELGTAKWMRLAGTKTVKLSPLGKLIFKLGGIYSSGYVAKYSIDVRLEDLRD